MNSGLRIVKPQIIGAAMVTSVALQAQSIVSVPSPAPGFLSDVGVRFRAFNRPSEQEVYLGNNLGAANGRVAANITFAASNPFTVSYNAATDNLSAVIGGQTLNWTWTPLGEIPEIRMSISSRSSAEGTTATVTLANLVLNGSTLGGAPLSVTSTTGSVVSGLWSVSGIPGFDFSQSFTLTGDLNLTALSTFNSGAESSKVEIYFGSPIPEPSTWAAIGALAAAAAWQWRWRSGR